MKYFCGLLGCLVGYFVFLICDIAQAGGRVGNGGDVRVCRDTEDLTLITEIELYDFYEARTKRKKLGLVPDLGGPELTVREKVDLAFDRLADRLPELAQRYRDRAHEILDEGSTVAVFLDDIVLEDIPDTDSRYWPAHCAVEQIAVREDPDFEDDPYFTFNNDLYRAFDQFPDGTDHQAGLIIHEVIYEHFFKLGEPNSRRARYFTTLISSRELEKMTSFELWKRLQEFPKLPIFRMKVNGYWLRYDSLRWDLETGALTDGRLWFPPDYPTDPEYDQMVQIQGRWYRTYQGRYKEKARLPGTSDFQEMWVGTPISFHRNGQVRSVTLKDSARVTVGENSLTTNEIEMHPDGSIAMVVPRNSNVGGGMWNVVTTIKGCRHTLSFRGPIYFHANGEVSKGLLNSDSKKIMVKGQPVFFAGWDERFSHVTLLGGPGMYAVTFHENGNPHLGYLAKTAWLWKEPKGEEGKWISVYANGMVVDGNGALRESTYVDLDPHGNLKDGYHQPLRGSRVYY